MMTTTTTTTDRTELDRRKPQRTMGPKTEGSKDRPRQGFQAVGIDARTLVLPGEDREVFQGRIDAWTTDLQPRNNIERYLVERAATVSWQLDRAVRAETARLAAIIHNASVEESLRQEEVAVIGATDAEKSAALSFDPSIEGERLRKHQGDCDRILSHTLGTLFKLRRSTAPGTAEPTMAGKRERSDPPQSESVVDTDTRIFLGEPDVPASIPSSEASPGDQSREAENGTGVLAESPENRSIAAGPSTPCGAQDSPKSPSSAESDVGATPRTMIDHRAAGKAPRHLPVVSARGPESREVRTMRRNEVGHVGIDERRFLTLWTDVL